MTPARFAPRNPRWPAVDSGQSLLPDMPHRLVHHRLDVHRRRVDEPGVGGRDERRYGPSPIAFVAGADVLKKGAQTNINPFFLQLVMTAPGALLRTCGQEQFERRVGEDHGAHVAAVGDEPRAPPEGAD